jgi:cytoskeletal protein CcmA (bactofilin family)
MWNREENSTPHGAPATVRQPASPAPVVPNDERRQVAWVGKSVVFRGDLISSEDMTIDGQIEGSIEVRDHHLTVGPNATINAEVTARVVTVFGKVTGSVTSKDKVEIRSGASVEAEIHCQSLAIQEGAYYCGKVDMSSKPKPAAAPAPGAKVATPA